MHRFGDQSGPGERSGGLSTAKFHGSPTRDVDPRQLINDVEDFIRANGVDEHSAGCLKLAPPGVQSMAIGGSIENS